MGFLSNVAQLAWWQHGLAVCLEMGHCAWLSEAVSSSTMLGWAGQVGGTIFPLAMELLNFLRSVLLDSKELQIHNRIDSDIKDL